jgi:hypothetical protein
VAQGEILVFLNPDISLDDGAIGQLQLQLLKHPGVAGPVLKSAGTTEHGATIDVFGMPRGIQCPGLGEPSPLYIMGCCLATNRRVFDRIGGFDARYFMFCEDVEYGWQCLRHGFAVSVVEGACAHHTGGGSTPGGYLREDKVEITAFRIGLRERNSVAMVLACASGARLPVMVALALVRNLTVAVVAALMGRLDVTRSIATGLIWNIHNLPGTLERRRSIRGRASGGGSRIRWRCFALEILLRWGMPVMVDSCANAHPKKPRLTSGSRKRRS